MNVISSFAAWLRALARGVWRLAWLLLSLCVILGLVLLGALVWLIARLLGKKPTPVKVRWGAMNPPPFGRQANTTPHTSDADVVDVQAREVPERPAALGDTPPRQP